MLYMRFKFNSFKTIANYIYNEKQVHYLYIIHKKFGVADQKILLINFPS